MVYEDRIDFDFIMKTRLTLLKKTRLTFDFIYDDKFDHLRRQD